MTRVFVLFGLLSLVAVGCDSTDLGGAAPPGASAFSSAAAPQDPRIDASDTYVVTNATITMRATIWPDESVFDAYTDSWSNRLILDLPSTTYSIEAGYDEDGLLVYNQTGPAPEGDPRFESVANIRSSHVQNGRLSFVEHDGQTLDLSGFGGAPRVADVLDDVRANTRVVTDGFVLSQAQLNAEMSRVSSSVRSGKTHLTESFVDDNSGNGSFTGSGETTLTRIYRPVGGDRHALNRIDVETDGDTDSGRIRTKVTIRFQNLSWHNDAVRDIGRRAVISEPGTIDPFNPDLPPIDWPPGHCDLQIDPSCTGTGTGTGGGGGSCSRLESGANVVYQHGANSDATTWDETGNEPGVRNFIGCQLEIGTEVVPSLQFKGHESHAAQTSELRGIVLDRATTESEDQFIFVGHSQGGLISRRVAQRFVDEGRSDLVRGVITVGTPHQGANVARNLPALGQFGAGSRFIFSQALCQSLAVCQPLYDVVRLGIDLKLGESSGTDAAADLVPGSPALATVNGVQEEFARFGIQNSISKRWAFARVAGASTALGGTRAVILADATFGIFSFGAVASIFTLNWHLAATFAALAADMIRADAYYHRITAGGSRTDGLIERPSQVYPGTPFNFEAVEPSAHPGETRRDESGLEIRRIMNQQLGVPTR